MLHLLINSMVEIAHSPDVYLRTLQQTLLTVSPRILSNERAMRIVKVGMFDSLPDVMHLVGRERNLPISGLSKKRIREQTIFGYDHIKENDVVPGCLSI